MTFSEVVGIIGSIPLPDDLVNDRILDAFGVIKDEVVKKVPKKPIVNNFDETQADWKCPVCGLNVVEEPPCCNYCERCGTKLDWKDIKEA